MSKNYILNDKPYELKSREEFAKEYEDITGEKYIQSTNEEKKEVLKEYERYMTVEQKKEYGLVK